MTQQMRCRSCGHAWWSAGAREMVERDERCGACGGRLRLVPGHDRALPLLVVAPPDPLDREAA